MAAITAGKPSSLQIADAVDDPDLRAEIQKAIDDGNRAVSHAEAIKKLPRPIEFGLR